MSYEVLALKWRPQTFDEVVGQDHITRTLKKAVELGRISHAYLFSGPRGCGKTSTARILAKVINCSSLQAGNPCNACDSCTGVIQGRNLDVMEIDGASHTGVNEVRDLQESIGYVPSQFKNKIYIIDEVHMLSTHAFNALLKTLEEPPAHVYFVFATTAPQKIPDTIKSRCQRHQFKRLEVRDVADHLEKICVEEKVEFEKDALRLLARKAEGSMRDGQSLLDQCITASSGHVTTQGVRDILGLLDQDMIFRFVRTIVAADAGAVLKELDSAIREGVDIEELVNALIEGFRDLMLLAVPGDLSDLVYRSADEVASMREVLEGLEVGDLVTVVERLCNLSPRLRMASDPRILLESALVDLALLDRQMAIRDLIGKLEGSGSGSPASGERTSKAPPRGRSEAAAPAARPASGTRVEAFPPVKRGGGVERREEVPAADAKSAREPENAPAPQAKGEDDTPAREAAIATLDHASQRRMWDSFVTFVRQKKATLGVCLISGSLQSIEGDIVKLRFPKGASFSKEQVEDEANRKFLRSMTKKFFGHDLEIVSVSAEGETRRKPKEPAAGDKPAESTDVGANPLVQKILDDFDGEIIRYHP